MTPLESTRRRQRYIALLRRVVHLIALRTLQMLAIHSQRDPPTN
jgi:hypothetical protein